jgi:electron transport complex protein RnfC
LALHSFKGGIHPKEYKELSKDHPIQRVSPPERIALPLSQHVGAPASPVVSPKDKVVKGQLVAEAKGFVSANIHSPVCGTVVSITQHYTCTGTRAESILIEVEDSEEEFRYEPLSEPSGKEIVERVKEAGIVGLGGAAFPTHVKLSPPAEYPVDTVIINGAECEPFLTVDYRLMLENADELLMGAELLKRAVDAGRVIIAVESNKADAAQKIRERAGGYSDIEVVVVPTRYPQGSEKHLIKTVLGREVPSGGLPFHVGVLVQNVQTTIAVKRAVYDGIPLYERVITVTGPSINNPGNFLTPLGALASYLIDLAGGLKEDVYKVIFGGPMTGIALGRLDVPVVKGTSGIVALSSDMAFSFDETDTCIRCARCVSVCPVGLEPYLLGTLSRAGRAEEALEHNLLDCIECGSCAYICPARRNLVQLIRIGKAKAREIKA